MKEEEENNTNQKIWNPLYTLVIVVEAVIIISLYFFTRHFR
jgi:hypothetical protein